MVSPRETIPEHGASNRCAAPAGVQWHPLNWAAAFCCGPRPLPVTARARLWLLFLALGLLKLGIVARFDKHLYEIHWRTAGRADTWLNSAAFGLFGLLGFFSLLRLGRYCRSVGVRAVRAANALVLLLGLTLILLTFHSGENNYLYPILTRVLKWTSLGPYLSLDLFFRPPFLAAWLFGYVAVYYVMARTGRELWTVYLTAVCAGAYWLLCLRELRNYSNELLVADCLGLVWLVRVPRSACRFSLTWLLAPAGWTLFFGVLIFRLALPLDRYPLTYLLLLVCGSAILFGAATLVARSYGFLAPWSNLLLFYSAAFFLLADANYPFAANYNNLLCLALEFPRYFAGELLLVAVMAAAATLHCRFWPKARLWWMDVLNVLFIIVAFIDLRLSQIMGVRLQWDVLKFANGPKMMWRMSKPYLPGALAGVAVAVLVYVLLLHLCMLWRGRKATPSSASSASPSVSRPFAIPGATTTTGGTATATSYSHGLHFVTACFVCLALLGLTQANEDKALGQAEVSLSSPLWKRATHRRLSPDEFLASAVALGLGDLAEPPSAGPTHRRRNLNVVLIFLESSYNRHLSLFGSPEDTQPLLSKYKERMELFPNFFSDFAGSIQARFATFTALYPVRDFNAFTLHRVGVKSVFEVLHDNGYTCSLFDSCFFDYTGFGDFLKQRSLDEMYDADNLPGPRTTERVSWGLREEETLAAMRSQIRKYAAGNQKFFLTYAPVAPHYPYDCVPKAFKRFKPGELGDFTPMYLNELLYIDWVLASLVDQLKESGLLDNTLVVITNDHGEQTGAHGEPVGHGWVLTPQLANTPLIIMDPEKPGYRLNYTIGSQVDLLPTILDRLGLPLPPDQLYQGRSLEVTNCPNGRLIYLNTYQQFGVIEHNRLILSDRQTDHNGAAVPKSTVYTISNEGSKTIFTEEPVAPPQPIPISRFDEFQESLLQDYSRYCSAVAKLKLPIRTAFR